MYTLMTGSSGPEQSFKNVKYSTINDENKYKSKDHLFIYFQNNNNGNKREIIYSIISISDKRLSSFFISLILSFTLTYIFFFSTFFVLILSYLSGTCTLFFADISGRNFLSSFGHFRAKLFSQVGGGGCTCTQCTPPPPCVRAWTEYHPIDKISSQTEYHSTDGITSYRKKIIPSTDYNPIDQTPKGVYLLNSHYLHPVSWIVVAFKKLQSKCGKSV